MKKLVITGHRGMVGSALLRSHGHPITVAKE
jgi:hypothetical protein